MMDSKEMVSEMEYQRGLEEAWECAKMIYLPTSCPDGIPWAELTNIFPGIKSMNDILRHYSASEAIAKIKEYKENQLKVGDEVMKMGCYGVVTAINDKFAYVVWKDGSCGCWEFDTLKKTGRHYTFIENFLKGFREDDIKF